MFLAVPSTMPLRRERETGGNTSSPQFASEFRQPACNSKTPPAAKAKEFSPFTFIIHITTEKLNRTIKQVIENLIV